MDLTFRIPTQYSLQPWTLLSPLDTSTTESCFHFSPGTPFFLELIVTALTSSPVAYWHLPTWGAYLPVSYLFAFSYRPWGSLGKSSGVRCHLCKPTTRLWFMKGKLNILQTKQWQSLWAWRRGELILDPVQPSSSQFTGVPAAKLHFSKIFTTAIWGDFILLFCKWGGYGPES